MISLVYPYYINPTMLAIHFDTWSKYREEIKAQVEMVIVDDGSPKHRAHRVIRPPGLPNVRIYAITEDRPWHQHGARNLGALVAKHPILLMTDMDHLVPEATLEILLHQQEWDRVMYTFGRVDAPAMTPTVHPVSWRPKPHPNSFAMNRELYWRIGGYDEDYCGIYGTDALFRKRAEAMARTIHLSNAAVLIRYSRDVIPDASTRDAKRKDGRDPNAKDKIQLRKIKQGREHAITLLNFPWERVF